jgi:hypothetical protein
MNKSNILMAKRALFGSVTIVAIGMQLGVHIGHGYNILNFFSYFTNLSNIFASIVLLMAAYYTYHKRKLPRSYDVLRGAATVAMSVVGITFVLLLRNEDLGSLMPWVNALLHYIMPLYMVLDWAYDPPKGKIPDKHIYLWALFPFAYLAYSLVRGAVTHWYAYPFLNPNKLDSGYVGVAMYCAGVLVVFGACSLLLRHIALRKAKS